MGPFEVSVVQSVFGNCGPSGFESETLLSIIPPTLGSAHSVYPILLPQGKSNHLNGDYLGSPPGLEVGMVRWTLNMFK